MSSSSSSADDIRDAFKRADDIMALEGYERTPAMAATQAMIAAGRMTFDQAVQQAIEQAHAADKPGSTS